MAESSKILLQIIPLKVIGDNGRSITTYGLVDSGSNVTMIVPSLVEQLEIQGETSQLFLSTVNQREKREQGVKGNFKIASVIDQDTGEIAVCNAWVLRSSYSTQTCLGSQENGTMVTHTSGTFP